MLSDFVLILVFIGASLLGLFLVRRRVALETLQEQHEVAGIAFAVLGGLYGIILAFVLVLSWERFEEARNNVELEANALGDLHFHAGGFSEPTRTNLRGAIADYLDSVIHDEWAQLNQGRLSEETQKLYFAAWSSILASKPSQSWEVALYQVTLDRLDDLGDARRHRLIYARSGLPDVIWYFLVFFAIATVGFTYFFGMRRLWPQAIITAVLTATIGYTLVLIKETQTPFAGSVRVSNRSFRIVEQLIQLEKQGGGPPSSAAATAPE